MAFKKSNAASPKSDPKEMHPKPPFEERKQPFPGLEEKMKHRPDHGEESYRGSGRLVGRTALITGGDSGIGRAVAIAFAREGADVVVSCMKEEEGDATETKRWVEEAGQKCLVLSGDIQDQRHCQDLVSESYSLQGRFDILVNNAAYQSTHEKLDDFSAEEFDRTFRTNVYAMFYLCQAAVPRMKPGSTIINTTSIQAYMPNPMLLAYAATKGAIVNFTKSLAKMVMESGIRVNAVAPGPVWTPLIPSTMPKEKVKDFGSDTSFERPAQPAELAPLFVFLASPESSYLTGEVLGATGGKTPH